MSDRYTYSSIERLGKKEDKIVNIYFSNIIDSKPAIKIKVELFSIFNPAQTIKVMNLRTLICLNESMILFHLNKFGFAEKV